MLWTEECGNYRTIALLSHTSKILLYIILQRLKAKIEFELADEQAGFREKRSAADMLCSLQVLIEKINETNVTIPVENQNEGNTKKGRKGKSKKNYDTKKMEAHIIFIDYSKAFDTVSHVALFQVMRDMGFPHHLIALISNLYTVQQAKIRWNNDYTEPFPIMNGVRQGCILSPHLFSVYTEQVMRESITYEMGISVGGRKVSNLRYADDTALCAYGHREATQLLESLDEAGKKKGLQLNASKTKFMHLGNEPLKPIEINGVQLEKVDHFKYLGSIKEQNGNCTRDINTRIGMAKRRMVDLNVLWKDKSIDTKLKLKVMKCLVWTVMTYGAEGWTLKQQDEDKINATEMWFYRRMLKISWKEKRTNKSILRELKTTRGLLTTIVKQKLSFFGHASRNKKCTLMRDIIQGKMEGKRRSGRPRKNYMDNIETWLNTTAKEAFDRTDDRLRWKADTVKAARAASDYVDAG